jgi:hypothetical protein
VVPAATGAGQPWKDVSVYDVTQDVATLSLFPRIIHSNLAQKMKDVAHAGLGL